MSYGTISVFLLQGMAATPELTTNMLVVFGIIIGALILFVTEALPIDITAVGVIVALVVLRPGTLDTDQPGGGYLGICQSGHHHGAGHVRAE